MSSVAGQRSAPGAIARHFDGSMETLYMIGSALIQIIKVNDQRSGTKDGRAWSMQDAECLLLDDNGQPSMVGVLQLPKDLMGDKAPKPGVYTGSFALKSGLRDRRIEAALVSLVDASSRIKTRAPGQA